MTIRVGEAPDQEDFVVHEPILSSRAEYFQRAMNGHWMESNTRVISLSDVEPEIFSVYLNSVYTGKIPSMTMRKAEVEALPWEEFRDVVGSEYDIMFQVYVLAERLNDPLTKNNIIHAVFDLADLHTSEGDWRVPPPSSIRFVYDGTPEKSPARRLMVDMWSRIDSASIALYVEVLPKPFLGDLAIRLAQSQNRNSGCIAKGNGAQAYLEKS